MRVSITEEEPGKEPRPIDVNMLPLIRKGTAFETLYRYRPMTCGPRTLVFEATARDAEERARLPVLVEVTADPARETEALIHMLQNDLPHGIQKSLKAKLRSAWRSFEREQNTAGFNKLNAFSKQVMAQIGKNIPIEDAERLLSAVNDIEECLMWN